MSEILYLSPEIKIGLELGIRLKHKGEMKKKNQHVWGPYNILGLSIRILLTCSHLICKITLWGRFFFFFMCTDVETEVNKEETRFLSQL